MQGAAVTLAKHFLASEVQPDVIIADDMLDLATFLALTRHRTARVPVILYMHENQLTYPVPEDPRAGPMRRNWGVRERAYGLLNWKAALAADAVWFNSHFHQQSFLDALQPFLNHYPEEKEIDSIAQIRGKAQVVPVGVEQPEKPEDTPQVLESGSFPLIIWNQRWEFDKNPAGFVAALKAVKQRDIPFKLAICGEQFHSASPLWDETMDYFSDELVHAGFAERSRYHQLLWNADLTISTAYHEFFGISLVEAMLARTFPILPHRLSYPELLPARTHPRSVYQTSVELVENICWALTHPAAIQSEAEKLAVHAGRFEAAAVSVQFDQKLADVKPNF